MSIKDKTNLARHIYWTGGDSGEVTGLPSTYFSLTRSHNYSTNGDYSIKATVTSVDVQFMDFTVSDYVTDSPLYFKVDINTNIPLSLKVYIKLNGEWRSNSVNIPVGESIGVSVTKYINEGATIVWCRIDATNQPVNSIFYVDNIQVYQ